MVDGRMVLGVCAAAMLALAVSASAAWAGDYQVAVCHDPGTGASAPLDGISFADTGSAVQSGIYAASDGECGADGYLYATLDGAVGHGPSDLASWRFSAPATTTIAEVALYRSFYAGASLAFRSPIDTINLDSNDGSESTVAACSQAYGCIGVGTGPATELDPSNALGWGPLSGIVAISGDAGCGGGQTCAAGGGAVCPELGTDPCMAANHLYAMVVTLEDDTTPIVSGVNGALVAPGTLSGTAGVSFQATDTGSGLYSAALLVDGQPVSSAPIASNGGRCSAIADTAAGAPLRFDWSVPCALAASDTVTLDTSALPDGAHTLALEVSDAAGNSTLAWSGVIHTDNAPQGGSPQLSGKAQVGRTLTASNGSWSPAPTSYSYQWLRCDSAGAACAPIQGASGSTYAAVSADAYHQLAVTVSAADADGATSATSALSGVVLDAHGYSTPPPSPKPLPGRPPQVSGNPVEGATLTAHGGGWADGPLRYHYQWQRCDEAGLGCGAIAGASGAHHVVVPEDDYQRLRVLVTVSGPGGVASAVSELTRVVADARGATTSGGKVGAGTATSPGNGGGTCQTPVLQATVGGSARVSVALGQRLTLRGSLRCGSAPIVGAHVVLSITPLAGAPGATATRVRTTGAGDFAFALAPGPSRQITLSYRSSAAPASARVTVLVRPALSLTITPTHTSNGHTIVFSGVLSGGHQPPGGLTLDIEYLEGRRWMVYDTVRARPSDGAFHYTYTFRRTTQPITYWFRVAIPEGGESGYPFQSTASPMRSVQVDP